MPIALLVIALAYELFSAQPLIRGRRGLVPVGARWLLAALGTGTPRLFGVLVITNLMVLIGVLFAARAIAGHTPRASQSAIEPASASLP